MENTDLKEVVRQLANLSSDHAILINEVKTLRSELEKKDRLLRTQLKIMEINSASREPKPRIMLTESRITKIRQLIDLNERGKVSVEDRKKVDTFRFYLRNGERENFVPFVTQSQQRMLEGLFDIYLTPEPATNDDAGFPDDFNLDENHP